MASCSGVTIMFSISETTGWFIPDFSFFRGKQTCRFVKAKGFWGFWGLFLHLLLLVYLVFHCTRYWPHVASLSVCPAMWQGTKSGEGMTGHPVFMEETGTQKQMWSHSTKQRWRSPKQPVEKLPKRATFSGRYDFGFWVVLFSFVLGLQLMKPPDNSARSVSPPHPLRSSLCTIKPPFRNVAVKL